MKSFKVTKVHISQINVGDMVKFEGQTRTINNNHIKFDGFMGKTLFGDSFNLGYKKVEKVVFN